MPVVVADQSTTIDVPQTPVSISTFLHLKTCSNTALYFLRQNMPYAAQKEIEEIQNIILDILTQTLPDPILTPEEEDGL